MAKQKPHIKRHTKHILAPTNTIQIKWLSGKFGNFIKDKVYTATTPFQHINNKLWTGFRITDEDGDFYTLDATHAGQRYLILTPEAKIEKW